MVKKAVFASISLKLAGNSICVRNLCQRRIIYGANFQFAVGFRKQEIIIRQFSFNNCLFPKLTYYLKLRTGRDRRPVRATKNSLKYLRKKRRHALDIVSVLGFGFSKFFL